jgi:putative restriction endonuclease
MVRTGDLLTNRVVYDGVFVGHFRNQWKRFVTTAHSPKSELPFFHMRTEGKPNYYWKLVWKPGFEVPLTTSHSVKSPRALQESLECAEIDKDLFALMLDPVSNELIRKSLIEHYFPHAKNAGNVQYNIFDQVHEEIVAEKSTEYVVRMKQLEQQLPANEFQEEVIVRSAVFRRDVLRVYNDTCAVSGLHVSSGNGAQLLDACHIVPFAESRDDHISNGICLSPNLHRAFDRHLIYFDDDFRFQIVPHVIEKADSPHSLKQLEGKQMELPKDSRFWPAPEKLRSHRERCL